MEHKFKVGDYLRFLNGDKGRPIVRKILDIADDGYVLSKNFENQGAVDGQLIQPFTFTHNYYELAKEYVWNNQLKELLNET